ncbi:MULTISPECIES: oligosaccharide flippase family protein [Vibrio]|uniref:oligosaccharide flippase family protein n=1 Tax=Vibrio TaxID=662 RepID=UPI001CF8E280|nr:MULTISPECIES: oligosaccharide flippase family protein [Vibrio]MCQ9070323.1 oligosaccharide flippase family protein [Vibrio alginolyticus]
MIRKILTVLSGSVIAQLITLGVTPFLTRIYTPQQYGELASFLVVVNILGPIAALAYPLAISLARTKKIARSVLTLCYVMTSTICSILFLGYLASWAFLDLPFFIALSTPIAVFCVSIHNSSVLWLNRNEMFGFVTKLTIFQSLLAAFFKLTFGYIFGTGEALIYSYLISYLSLALLFFFCANYFCNETRKFNMNEIDKIAREYKNFPIYRAPQIFLNAVFKNTPILILGAVSSSSVVGFYSLSNSVLILPLVIMGKSISSVFYPMLARKYNEDDKPYDFLIKVTKVIFFISICVFTLLSILSEMLFTLIFGPEWTQSGEITRYLCIWFVFYLTSKPIIDAIPIYGLQKFHLKFEIVTGLLGVSILYFLLMIIENEMYAIFWYSIAMAIFCLLLIYSVTSKIRKSLK